MLKVPFKSISLITFLEFLRLTTVVFIVEAHSRSEKVEVCIIIKYTSIAGECLLSNHAVVCKGKSGHQNCIDLRKTCLTTPWTNGLVCKPHPII